MLLEHPLLGCLGDVMVKDVRCYSASRGRGIYGFNSHTSRYITIFWLQFKRKSFNFYSTLVYKEKAEIVLTKQKSCAASY